MSRKAEVEEGEEGEEASANCLQWSVLHLSIGENYDDDEHNEVGDGDVDNDDEQQWLI